MKTKEKIIIVTILLLAMIGGFFGWKYYTESYITIDETIYRRDITYLNLSGRTVNQLELIEQLQQLQTLNMKGTKITIDQYNTLRAALPNCEIQWDVPFQGGYISYDTPSLTLTHLSKEDIDLLQYLPEIESINALDCEDYPEIMLLKERYPEYDVAYSVTVGDKQYSHTTSSITVRDIHPDLLDEMLPYLPNVTAIEFKQKDIPFERLVAFANAHPDIAVNFKMDFMGQECHFLDTEVDISYTKLENVDEVEALAVQMPNLKKVIMSYCGISNEDMDALNRRHEDILFVWTVQLGSRMTLRTDADYFMPIKYDGHATSSNTYNLRYCTELLVIDVGHMEVYDLSFLQYTPKLKYLILADSQIRDISYISHCKELIFLELFLTAVNDYSPLLSCTKLEDLNICYTKGDPEIIMQMPWLKRLWWSGNGLSIPQMDAVKAALPNTEIVFNTWGATDKGWRQGQNYFDMRDILGMYYMPF